MHTEVFIGLGSNLGDRAENLRKAIVELSKSSIKIQLLSSKRDNMYNEWLDAEKNNLEVIDLRHKIF